jgi:adenosylcobinamide-GDP ribazoletransferase
VRAALAFLTAAPGRGATEPDARTFGWFPVVGAVVGALLGAVWWTTDRAWDAPVAAALVVAIDLGITGMLHFDGLVDAADGLLPALPAPAADRRLAIMADPGVGAFGIASGAMVLLLRFVALLALHPSVALLAALWCASRTHMAVIARAVPYARGHAEGGGLASAFLGGRPWAIGAGGLVLAVLLAVAWRPVPGIAAIVASGAAAACVTALAWRRVHGFTGDVLGAAGIVGETAGLLVAAARW